MDEGLTFDFEADAQPSGGHAGAAASAGGQGGAYAQGRFGGRDPGGGGYGGGGGGGPAGGYRGGSYGGGRDGSAGLQSGPTRAKKNTVCRFYLQRKCTKGAMCEYLHFIDKDKMPECKYGVDCDNPACMYKHTGRDQVCVKYCEGFCPFGPFCKYGHKPRPAKELPAVALVFTADQEAATRREQIAMQGQGPRSGMGYNEPAPGPVPADGVVPRGTAASGGVDAQGRLLSLVSEYVLTAADKKLPAASATGPLAFFTVKALDHKALKASVRDGLWIVPDAMAATLEQGLAQFTGGIFLFFSSLGSKAFQGCAQVTGMYKPAAAQDPSKDTASGAAAASGGDSASGAVELAADVKPDVSSDAKAAPTGYQFVRIRWLRMCALPFKAVAMVRNPASEMSSVARCADWGQLPVPVGLALLVLCWRRPKLRVNASAAKGEIVPVDPAQLAAEDVGKHVAEADALTTRELESGGAGEGGIKLLSRLAGTGCHQQREPPVIGVSGGLSPQNVPAQAVSRILQHSNGRPWAALSAAWASGPGRLSLSGEAPPVEASASSSTAVRAVAATELHDGIDETEFPPDPEPEGGFGFILGVTGANIDRAIKTGTVFMEDAVLAEGMAAVRAGTPVLLWNRDIGSLHGLFVALDRSKELRISGGMGKPAFVRAIAPFAVACRLADLPITAQDGLWEMAGVPPQFQPPNLPQASIDISASSGSPRSGLVSRRFLAEAAFRMQMATRAPAPLAARMAAVIRHLRGLPIAPRPGDPLAPGFPLPTPQAGAAGSATEAEAAAAVAGAPVPSKREREEQPQASASAAAPTGESAESRQDRADTSAKRVKPAES